MIEMKKYSSPDMQIILLSMSDVVRTSPQGGGGGNLGGGEDELPVIPFI